MFLLTRLFSNNLLSWPVDQWVVFEYLRRLQVERLLRLAGPMPFARQYDRSLTTVSKKRKWRRRESYPWECFGKPTRRLRHLKQMSRWKTIHSRLFPLDDDYFQACLSPGGWGKIPANAFASSVGTARRCLKSDLLPTNMMTILESAWSRSSFNQRTTFSYVMCLEMS